MVTSSTPVPEDGAADASDLADAAPISIGHRPGLDRYHDRTVVLVRGEEGARLIRKPHRRGKGISKGQRLARLFGGRLRRNKSE